jgi:hypothetical protein
MEARRFFCTRLRGFRVGATANGTAMGSTLRHRSGLVRFAVDVQRGPESVGRALSVQVLMTGTPLPNVVHAQTFAIPPEGELLRFEVPINVEDGRWAVLRFTDPAEAADKRAPASYQTFGNALAYTSPFYLDPEGVPASAPASSSPPPSGRDGAAVESGRAPRIGGSLPATGAAPAVAAAATVATVTAAALARVARREHEEP